MKVAEYIAEFLVEGGFVRQCFSVTGGFAMHLNDAFGERLDVTYTHGENPAGYAALGWSSVRHEPSVCCVTSGCGATNAVTPCLIAYQDSVPVFFISGQVHSTDNIRSMGGDSRGYFGSDCDIVECVKGITKFSHELADPRDTRRVLEACRYHLTSGRPGPAWLSVPVDVQAMQVDPDTLPGFAPPAPTHHPSCADPLPDAMYDLCEKAERPIVLAGNGVHLSRTASGFARFIGRTGVPFVVSYFGSDLEGGDGYTGTVGIIGNRSGNYAIQTSDLILCLGCRLSKSITGYNRDIFAPDAKIICVDIDEVELAMKDRKRFDLAVRLDLRHFFDRERVDFPKMTAEWTARNAMLRERWSCELPPKTHEKVCVYRHLKSFFEKKAAGSTVVASSGSLFCATWHMYRQKRGDRFVCSSHGDMGYELPVSIGAALRGRGRRTFCLVGDGSFQYNLQELATLKNLNLPLTIMVFNNGGYGAIKLSQKAVFKREFGTELSFSSIERMAVAHDLPYYLVSEEDDDLGYLKHRGDGPCVVEILCEVQERYPKISNRLDETTNKFINVPYDDMFPFLTHTQLFGSQ